MHVTAQHLPGAQNAIVDAESWSLRLVNWKLNFSAFHKIIQTFGPLEVASSQCVGLSSASATSADGHIHLQKQQMLSSKPGLTSGDIANTP